MIYIYIYIYTYIIYIYIFFYDTKKKIRFMKALLAIFVKYRNEKLVNYIV